MASANNDALKAQLAESTSSLQTDFEANNTLVDQNKDPTVEVSRLRLDGDSMWSRLEAAHDKEKEFQVSNDDLKQIWIDMTMTYYCRELQKCVVSSRHATTRSRLEEGLRLPFPSTPTWLSKGFGPSLILLQHSSRQRQVSRRQGFPQWRIDVG